MYWTLQTREQENTHVLEIPSSPNAGRRDGLSGVTALNLLEPNTSLGKTPPGPPPLTDVSAVVVVVGTLPPWALPSSSLPSSLPCLVSAGLIPSKILPIAFNGLLTASCAKLPVRANHLRVPSRLACAEAMLSGRAASSPGVAAENGEMSLLSRSRSRPWSFPGVLKLLCKGCSVPPFFSLDGLGGRF